MPTKGITLPSAAPAAAVLAVLVAQLVLGFPAVVGGAAVGAEELAGEQIGVIADALSVFYILASSQQNGIGLFP